MRRAMVLWAGAVLLAAPAAAGGSTGGGQYRSAPATVATIACRVGCVDAATARPGSLLRVKGDAMRQVGTVTFLGGRGDRDDVVAPVAEATPRSVVVQVPSGAVTGRLRLRNRDGSPSAPSTAVLTVASPATGAAGRRPVQGLSHVFPVQGPHGYGGAAARFGAGRDGHVHQGQDVLAACGTPLVAARGGVVRWNATQARAGNYVVIDGDGTDVDYTYMHLAQPSPVARGAAVATGQVIGAVGDTGAASACHLHFELWTGPGWYEGGSPFDPLPLLQAWDR